LQDYYKNHKSQFKKPEQVNVQYAALYFGQNNFQATASEEEIQDYYSEHIEEFSLKDKSEGAKPLEEVKGQIKEGLIQDKIKALLEDKIWQFCDASAEEPALFKEVAQKNQLEVKESGFFGPQEVIPEIGLSYEFLNAAFILKVGEVSNVIETPKGYFVIKIKEKKAPYIPQLDEIKEKVGNAVIEQTSWQLAKAKGQDLLSQIKKAIEQENLNFSKAAEKLSLPLKETEKFTRTSYVSEIGQSPRFTQAAFELKAGQISRLIRLPNGYCILSLKEIFPVEEEKFAREKEEFAKGLLARKKDILYKVWLAKLEKKARLVNNIGKKTVK